MKVFHHFDDSDIRAVVDELVICLGGVGPTPRVREGVKLRLAYFAAGLAEENVVIGVGIERRIEIDEIDARVRELARVAQPAEVIAEIKPVQLR